MARTPKSSTTASEAKPTKPTKPTKTTKTTSYGQPTASANEIAPQYSGQNPDIRLYVGDCREVLPAIPEVARGEVDLIFADPPFNWKRGYDKWDDDRPVAEYLDFTYRWIDLCIGALKPSGSLWINIPDDWAAEIVMHCKGAGLLMRNWCIWHYRFGQNNRVRFISSKVHALYFVKSAEYAWNLDEVLEQSDRATTYFDPRTMNKTDGVEAGLRAPMDVWYGQYWGRIQGNNVERRAGHDNQLPEVYLERVIRACSNPGDLVLDPFNGSGTTGTVARELGRRFIGTEFSEDLAKSAWERMTKIGCLRVKRGVLPRGSSAIFAPRNAGEKAKAVTLSGTATASGAAGEGLIGSTLESGSVRADTPTPKGKPAKAAHKPQARKKP